MPEAESTTGERVQRVASEFTAAQQAVVATVAAVVTGFLLAIFGLALDLGSDQVVVTVSTLGVLVVAGLVYAFFRAMLQSAQVEDGDPLAVLNYPLFPALFLLLAVSVGLYVAVVLEYA